MKHSTFLLFTAIALLLATTCGQQRKHVTELLDHAANVVEQYPDSALLLLDSIANPESLPKPLYMEYVLRRVQAKDKANKNIVEDSATVQQAAAYFVQNKNWGKAALAEFYNGRVHQENKHYDEATKAYLRTNNYAALAGDINMQGLACHNLGKLNYEQMLINEAILYYRKAYSFFHSIPTKYQYEFWALTSIGHCFIVNKSLDSAMLYFSKGLTIANQHNDSILRSNIYQSMGIASREGGDYSKAHIYFKNAVKYGTNNPQWTGLYYNLSRSFLDTKHQDSALYYAHQIVKLSRAGADTTAINLANMYDLLAKIETQAGHHKKALEYHMLYAIYLNLCFEEILSSSVLEIQNKYSLEQMENRHNKQTIRFQKVTIGILFLLFLTTITIFWLYRRNKRIRERLNMVEQNMHTLMQEAKRVVVKEKEFMQMQGQQLDTVKKASLLKSQLSVEERDKLKDILPLFNLAIYGYKRGSDWEMLYHALNEMYGGKLERMHYKYLGILNEAEFKIYCLWCSQFDVVESSIIMGVSQKTIVNRRTNIRKKLGIAGNINDFIDCQV